MAVSPGGGTVFVTGGGTRTGAASGDDDITVAYNAATGARRWVSRYNGPAGLKDDAHSLAVAPGSREVVVTVASQDVAPASTTPRSPTTPPPAPGSG